MAIKQLTVFIQNKQGSVVSVTDILSKNNINLRALSIAETQDCPEAETFQQWGISADELDSTLFLQPDNDHWTVEDISEDLYSDRFTMLQEAAILLKTHGVVEESSASVIIRFLVRDSDGNPVSYNNQQINWLALWQDGICILQIPQLPELAGDYTIDVFFNEQLIGHWIFSMVESE